MNSKKPTSEITPPRLISSFTTGFNLVAGNVQVIIPPILLDIFLWLGPHLSLNKLLSPLFAQATNNLPEMSQEMVAEAQKIWQQLLELFNLFSTLRTLPVGIPGMLANSGNSETPFGKPFLIELNSFASILGAWLVLVLVGIVLGCFYFYEISRISSGNERPPFKIFMGREFIQSLTLSISMAVFFIIVFIPASMLTSLIGMFSPTLMQVALMVVLFFILWLFFPLVFSPHGIFMYRQNAFVSILTSIRTVRAFLPGTTLFITVAILISQGSNIIWLMPPDNSWMFLIGIFGHAFIVTALLTSSFVYYRGCIEWLQEAIRRHAATNKPPTQQDASQ